jgi:hypothetical protein
MSILKYSELNDRNEPRPCNPKWFERELETICRQFSVRLRLVWCPERTQREMVGYKGNQAGRIGAAYSQNPPCFDYQHLGWWVVGSRQSDAIKAPDMGKIVRREGPFGLPKHFPQQNRRIHYDEKRDCWWIPEWVSQEVSYNRWLVEQKLSDRERQDYEEKTFDPQTLELVQELVWPADGLWAALGSMIAEHSPLCCNEANELGALCPGKYREPNRADLDAIRQAIQARNRDGLWEGVDADNSRAVNARRAQREQANIEQAIRRKQLYREMIGNASAPALAKLTPMSIGGLNAPLHLKPFNKKDFESLIMPR